MQRVGRDQVAGQVQTFEQGRAATISLYPPPARKLSWLMTVSLDEARHRIEWVTKRLAVDRQNPRIGRVEIDQEPLEPNP